MKSLVKRLVEECVEGFKEASQSRGFDRKYVSIHSSNGSNDDLVDEFAFQLEKELSPEFGISVVISYERINDGKAYDIDFDGLMRSQNEELQRNEYQTAFLVNYNKSGQTTVDFETLRMAYRALYEEWFDDSLFTDEMKKFRESHPNLKERPKRTVSLSSNNPHQPT